MPRVSTPENSVGLAEPTQARFQAADNGGGTLGGIAAGLKETGEAGAQLAAAQDQLDSALDGAGARTGINALMSGARDIVSGVKSQQGLNAANALPDARAKLAQLYSDASAQMTNSRMLAMFKRGSSPQMGVWQSEMQDHVNTQLLAAENTASDSRISLSANEASSTSDQEHYLQSVATGRTEIADRNARMGLGPEVTAAQQLQFTSGIGKSIISGKLANDDIDGAVAYHAANAGQMTAADNLAVDEMLKNPLDHRQALNDWALAVGKTPVAGTIDSRPVAGPATMFGAIMHIESGGRQFAANGQPLTSPKGAIGAAQIMPDTGPEAARLAGVPWDLDRLKSDPAYNQQLGNALFQHLVGVYGDPLKAAAAYNAGPGNVNKAVAAATADGSSWQSHLPDETQAYVKSFQAGIGAQAGIGVQQVPERWDPATALARVDTLADQQGWSIERRERAKAVGTAQMGTDKQLLDDREDNAERAAEAQITAMGGDDKFLSTTQISPQVWGALKPSVQLQYTDRAATNTKKMADGDDVDANGDTAFNLHRMADRDPQTFGALNLGMYRNKVTRAEYEDLARLQDQVLNRAPAVASHSAMWGVIDRNAPYLGGPSIPGEATSLSLDFSRPKAGTAPTSAQTAGRQTSMRIFSGMQADLNATTGGKRQPNDDEIQHAYDRQVRKVVINGDTAHPVPFYTLGGVTAQTNVPDSVRSQIVDVLRQKRIAPTEGAIAGVYRQYRGQPGFWR